jgi:atypical protein kinase C iota type
VFDVELSVLCCREVLITYINPNITLEQLCEEIRDMCKFTPEQAFTVKWVDEEGTYYSWIFCYIA